MMSHPYRKLPDHAYWRRAVAEVAPGELDPVVEAPFRFTPRDKVATAGSCFAQHIGRHLAANGCNYLVTESAHPIVGPQAERVLNYRLFTARYGNIYTARQLLQLFERAYGRFVPNENVWKESEGLFLDPFRPNIQPGGYNCERELEIDRERHLRAVREAFETLDVFVFTLGLTEAWGSRDDGAIFPLCPGVAGGRYSSKKHEFVNFGVDEVVADMTSFISRLRRVNPRSRVILTVSPVPLVATAEPRHVLVSTVYSKSVLRVACDLLSRRLDKVAYFPAYEVVAGGAGEDYFAADRRSVTEAGVAHVMRLFMRHYVDKKSAGEILRQVVRSLSPTRAEPAAVSQALRLVCDEEALELDRIARGRADEPKRDRRSGPAAHSVRGAERREGTLDEPLVPSDEECSEPSVSDLAESVREGGPAAQD